MDREELAVALLLSLPVAVGVATGVLKQTRGSMPGLGVAAGLAAGGAVLGLVVLARRSDVGPDPVARLSPLVERALPERDEAGAEDLLLAAGAGAVLSVFLWYIPLSPLLGGILAGFLQGGSRADARAAGTLSGALAPVVVLAFGVVALIAFGATVFGRFPFGPGVAAGLAVAGTVYAVGLGTVGGWVGGLALDDGRPWGSEVG